MFVRVNYFGSYFAVHADDSSDALTDMASAAATIDVEASYYVNDSITLSAGAVNLFDQEAERLANGIPGILGAKYYESGPFDYNGGFYYLKATYNF